jgi:hypothetical protein
MSQGEGADIAHDIFIRYAAKDKATADALCATLEASGIGCRIAPRDILPGIDWGEAIIEASKARGNIPCFLGRKNRPPMIGVRGDPLSNTLDMGGPDDDLPSDPVVRGLS